MNLHALIFFATGFEEVEALASVDILRRAGLDVQTVSITGDRLVTGSHGVSLQTDLVWESLDVTELPDLLVLPGGLTNLNEHEPLLELIRRQHAAKRWIGAICASPRVLAAAGIGEGRYRATCYPGCEEQVTGFVHTGADVEVCEHLITGRGPALSLPFAFELLRQVAGEEKYREVAAGFLYCG